MSNKWMNIETVPKDGTLVDLLHKNGFRVTEVWWDDTDLCFSDVTIISDYTHWMPLPEPPKDNDNE